MVKRGVKDRGLSKLYRHTQISISAKDWDKLNFLASGQNKTVSRFIVDTIFKEDREPSAYESADAKVKKSICLKEEELENIKALAEKYNLPVSRYIIRRIF